MGKDWKQCNATGTRPEWSPQLGDKVYNGMAISKTSSHPALASPKSKQGAEDSITSVPRMIVRLAPIADFTRAFSCTETLDDTQTPNPQHQNL